MNRYDLADFEWSVIEPLLPNEPRGSSLEFGRQTRPMWRSCRGEGENRL